MFGPHGHLLLKIIPKFIHSYAMIKIKQYALFLCRMDSFWDGMMVLLIKPNQYLNSTLRSFFIGSPDLNRLGVPSNMRGSTYFFMFSKDLVLII